eukprot:CAMPEP_0170146982 /NCGR_PEP_ID=MMETSP0033_2-20121228/32707_1 /TAXON_ID=195969 /ORGANISM="Dolichomastix tenuilepis, Strain CCMP3274" /LENGTH=50 /DNA_ID=CAMNT_0010383749 /DNA_START=95 /DNA_END=244 /DNA_ORIENTATION=-
MKESASTPHKKSSPWSSTTAVTASVRSETVEKAVAPTASAPLAALPRAPN